MIRLASATESTPYRVNPLGRVWHDESGACIKYDLYTRSLVSSIHYFLVVNENGQNSMATGFANERCHHA